MRLKELWPNHSTPGRAGIAFCFEIGHHLPGLPEAGLKIRSGFITPSNGWGRRCRPLERAHNLLRLLRFSIRPAPCPQP